jgi:Protein of unknown function (DUF2815)
MAKIITPECRLSFPQLLVARAMTDSTGAPQGAASFSAAFVFEPGQDLTAIKQAIAATVIEKFGMDKGKEILSKMVPGGSVKNPLRADLDKKYGDGSHFFVNARNKQQPQCVHPYADPATGKPKLMTAEEVGKLMYAGAYVRASLNPFWFDKAGNKGVAFGLNNLQWLRDGERLDNRVAAENEFEAVVDAGAGAADLASLMG